MRIIALLVILVAAPAWGQDKQPYNTYLLPDSLDMIVERKASCPACKQGYTVLDTVRIATKNKWLVVREQQAYITKNGWIWRDVLPKDYK